MKSFGAIYLILGTCIAGGFLGLPVVTAEHTFTLTLIMIFLAWFLMTGGAWCLLQVTLRMPTGANLVSMSRELLGRTVQILTWCIYLLLLYSLICVYLTASSDLLQTLLASIHLTVPRAIATIAATLLLGSIVCHGIQSVDWVNRVLMSVKIIVCLLLIASVIPYSFHYPLQSGANHWNNTTWLVIVCAFGYAIILPSIRDYVGNDRKKLTRIVMIGSIIPLILYAVWIAVIQGALPKNALSALNHSDNTASMLMEALIHIVHLPFLQSLSVIFISICSVTGFLGTSLCLVDFLADGISLPKTGRNIGWLALLAFAPPTLIVILDPAIFISALAYAGFFCLFILIALPVAMYVAMRYSRAGSDLRSHPRATDRQ